MKLQQTSMNLKKVNWVQKSEFTVVFNKSEYSQMSPVCQIQIIQITFWKNQKVNFFN